MAMFWVEKVIAIHLTAFSGENVLAHDRLSCF